MLLGAALGAPGCATSRVEPARSPAEASLDPQDGGGGDACERWPASQRKEIAAVQPHVKSAAKNNKLDPRLINAVIWVESKFNARARGPGGTQGLMQLMPSTARELASSLGERSRPLDPGFNVRAGSLYLARMIRKFDGNTDLGLAAYHGGPGHVLKWRKAGKRGVPEGSKKYVEKINAAKKMF
ncbi:lytic transglycosylase domain-containing protein [Nannocystis pusilla]|uniref:Lytic transglycosylase domain-containing protein n=1 Tax=Nannocystis pusilla TaxID=889268 RepID=A0A9X3EZ47_9BACT|nr:lytic transglycosylase domain-containing protein [Nannocystis pusilla]MCY1012937.1 lytic transglycosylase domain-containing protein [Nannocystis pusilla]